MLAHPGRVPFPALRPEYEKVRATTAKSILPLDPPSAIDYPLQKCLQPQLRSRLLVGKALHPVLSVLPIERLEGHQELRQVQVPVRADVPSGLRWQKVLLGMGQLPPE